MFPLYDDNRSSRVPWVTRTLLVLNVLVFLYELSLGQAQQNAFVENFGFVPLALRQAPVHAALTALSSLFVHGGLMHVLGNMWFLWIFGDNVEDRFGHVGFAALYLIWGVVAALGQALFGADPAAPLIGASGAISGVLGAYLVLYPRARIRTFVPIFIIFLLPWVPALVYLPYWLVIQVFSLRGGESGVAFIAHVSGFLAGALLALLAGRSRLRL